MNTNDNRPGSRIHLSPNELYEVLEATLPLAAAAGGKRYWIFQVDGPIDPVAVFALPEEACLYADGLDLGTLP